MKYRALLLALGLCVISCEDFLEEDLSTLITSESGALSNADGLTAALAGAYKPLSSTWGSGLGNASTQAILMGSDDLTTHKASNKADFREFDQFKVSETNERLPFVWNGAYKSIQGANNIIANYENATGDEAAIEQIAGEAFFLRAYNYFWIVRLWGEAPLVLETHIFDEAILTIENSSTSDLYDQIVADLKAAEGLLSNTKPQPGRVNKGTAKAILAEVYLHMAGYPLNDASYYALAASKAKEVIDNESSYGFGLMDDFADLWAKDESTNNDGNEEEVFALTFWAGEWYNANCIYGSAARPSDEGGWDDYFSELTFFNDFPEGYRKDVTFYTELADGTTWENFSTGRPYYEKLLGPDKWMSSVSLPLERMAEVYLVYAEAQVMATGPSDADALEAVNKIVRRAAGLPPDTPDASVDWTSATQDEIVQEKAWEFAGEYCRWFDLVRLQKVEEVVALKDPDDLQPLGSIQYFLPLPASETLANPNL